MKPIIKIDFVDFWDGFDKMDNFLWKLLSERYELIISENPDFVIFSNYGTKFYFYKCVRIFYSRENERPDFSICDYAITSDFIDRKNHFRFPVFGSRYTSGALLQQDEQNLEAFFQRPGFCCLVVSNGKAKKRIDFFKTLSSQYKQVDSGGRYQNNIGYAVEDKMEFLKKYKFIIAFENSRYPGYTTEKLYDALVADCIPIYWGDPRVAAYFNPKRFIDYSSFKTEKALLDRIREVDENDELAKQILAEPCFINNTIPFNVAPENLLNFFTDIFNKNIKLPIAFSNPKKLAHLLKSKKKHYLKKYFDYPKTFR